MAAELALPDVRADARPLVVHVVYRFDTGGLENGVVNLINHLPRDAFRHTIVALTEVTDFASRIRRDDVGFVSLHKPLGHTAKVWPQLFRLFRQLRPAVVHTRNLAALEAVVPAWAAGVPVRVHGEHGWDVGDLNGASRKYRLTRQFYRHFVHRQIALSGHIASYLRDTVGVPGDHIAQICNGVDTQRFRPPPGGQPQPIPGCPFDPAAYWLVGTVGRMQTVKDQPTLARAFVAMLAARPELRERVRLVLVGDGPLRESCAAILAAAGLADLAWLPGERSDIDVVLRGLHAFVLPSLAEGISNTILEAMASGLPVLATDVGGNGELVAPGRTGELVPAADPAALAAVLGAWAAEPSRACDMGTVARAQAERQYSLQAMMDAYRGVYEQELRRAGVPLAAATGAN